MAKKDIDWANIGFGYIQTEKRYVTNFKNGEWDKGGLIEDPNIVLSECAGVLQYPACHSHTDIRCNLVLQPTNSQSHPQKAQSLINEKC